MNLGIDGKTAVVTGAAKGIGAAIARSLAEEGARVVILDIDGATAEKTAAALATLNRPVWSRPLDVSDRKAVVRCFADIQAELGGVEILVNNAGIVRKTPTTLLTSADIDLVEGVNFRGALYCCQSVMEGMRVRGWGRIVNVLSLAVKMIGSVDALTYATSKAALGGLTKVLAKDLAPHGVTVNGVLPGTIGLTDFSHSMGIPPDLAVPAGVSIPVGRRGTPEDVAPVVAFLCSELARYVTGEFIDVNGGMLMD
jgi:NAD(P)-dependent dehydrogenase (short-subunit alcohol dehydrogenase family)